MLNCNLRPRGRGGQGGIRGAAALSDSPLLAGAAAGYLPEDVFDDEVLPLLGPTARPRAAQARRAGVGTRCCGPKLACAGRTAWVKLLVKNFIVGPSSCWLGRKRTGARGTSGPVPSWLRAGALRY